jgi:flagellar biosynthesis protein FlhG
MPKNDGNKGPGAEVWAVGGGKGGTGKSFITSSIGVCLASRGGRVVMLDADLGGANLHSFLGINRPEASLTDFFEKDVPLKDLVVKTGIARMGLVSGDIHSLASDSIRYTQKLKLFRHIKGLDADYVLIDLGSGSHNNTLDTFLFADRKIIVSVPEITAIENMYHFIKNMFFRRLKMTLGRHGMKDIVIELWKRRDDYGIRNLSDLLEYLKDQQPELKDDIDGEILGLNMNIVLNKVRSGGEIPIGMSVKSVCSKFLGLGAQYVGYVEYDDTVWRCTNNGRPFMLTYPSSRSAKELKRLCENLLGGQQVRVV